MIAIGRPGIEAELGFKDASSCAGTDVCFAVGKPSRAMVGTNAGRFYGNEVNSNRSPGADCWVFLYEDSGGWHYVNGRCVISEVYTPGPGDRVFVTGCANVRDAQGCPLTSSAVCGMAPLWTSTARRPIWMDTSGGTCGQPRLDGA
jgi:hypothetical protein